MIYGKYAYTPNKTNKNPTPYLHHCIPIPLLFQLKTLKCKSVVDGDIIILNCDFLAPYYIDKTTVVHHGINEDAMRIWCKKIDERNREFIKRFILDYL